MDVIITFAIDNKEWLFSGIGIAVITLIGRFFFKKRQAASTQSIHAGDGSTNIQSGGDVKVTIDKRTNNNDVE